MESDKALKDFEKVKAELENENLSCQHIGTGVCPRCGYCPHCGRGGSPTPWQPAPYYPYQPAYPWIAYTAGTNPQAS